MQGKADTLMTLPASPTGSVEHIMTSEGGSLSLGERVKKDFEVLGRQVNGHPLVYLDNAATSQKPTAMLQVCPGPLFRAAFLMHYT